MQTPKLVNYSTRTIIKLAMALAMAAGLSVAVPSPASAGQSVCIMRAMVLSACVDQDCR